MKIICVGRNYAEHARELGNEVPTKPVLFIKPSSALKVNHKPFYIPEFTNELHYEGEIVIKINQHGKHIAKQFAHKYYDQITIGFDLTARDLQRQCKEKGLPWEISKAFDGAAIVGKFVPINEVSTPVKFHITKNQKTVQEGSSDQMIFSIDELVAYISTYFTLNKGDMIFTGTPAGVGPLAIGDQLEGFIEDKNLVRCDIK